VDLASIDLIEKLHEDEGVEDDGVVLRWRGVERRIATTVDVKYPLAWRVKNKARRRNKSGKKYNDT